MAIKPGDLSVRLKQSFRIEAAAAVGHLRELIEETPALVETHLPGFETAPYRADMATRRAARDTPPVESG